MPSYNPNKVENEILSFWNKNKIYDKWKKKLVKGKPYYFLQGPPFTSGRLHIGHAWNNALKDIILRYKRLKGFNVWDRAGYDMHGLPVENKVQKELGLEYKEDIEKYGVGKFIKACEKYSIKQAKKMDQDLLRLAVWMDYENAYYPIDTEFIEGEWFLIKKAYEKNRLYKGKKIMQWCSSCETALAKHELDYKNVVDESIFLKLKLENKKNEYLIIWTTTPWTIPFNLAVMVNPELDYVKAEVEGETWIVAKALIGAFIGSVVNKDFKILNEFKGGALKGLRYEAPFKDELKKQYEAIESKHLHTVLLSKEYVDTSAGTGLVHCAPGCGPEDYEVGEAHDLPAFNNISHRGIFFDMGNLNGLIAKQDDYKFIELLQNKGCLIETTKVDHEYAHCWRCMNPVIFRATVQWFMKVEDLVDDMLEHNKAVKWIPEFGKTAFKSWVESLKDNSITRQRYWGAPVPIWECSNSDCNKITVIGSLEELEKKSGKKLKDLHKPWIDDVKVKCGCGSEATRVSDVLDVWIDSGTLSWNCLYYPREKEYFKKFFPADMVLEATEQVRLWFSMLMMCSLIALKKSPFKNVYMHGMILDYQGVKMSKSLGNIISPYEVIDKYGSDVLRYYMCENAAGETFNFNWENVKVKQRNITVLYNLSNLLVQMAEELKVNPSKLRISDKDLSVEEYYILSVLNSKLKKVTQLFDQHRINEVITVAEDLFLELSRSYVKFVRDKSSTGSLQERKVVVATLFEVLFIVLRVFSTIAPFVCEKIYQNLKSEFKLKEESIFFYPWPKHNSKRINKKLESDMDLVKNLIQAVLHSREKARLGVRWPLKEAVITAKDSKTRSAIRSLNDLIVNQVNVKSIKLLDKAKERAWVIFTDFKTGRVYIDTKRTPILEAEGFARELMRRIQGLRKKAGLKKLDKVRVHLVCDSSILELLSKFGSQIKDRVGAKNFVLSVDKPKKKFKRQSIEVIKHLKFVIHLSKV